MLNDFEQQMAVAMKKSRQAQTRPTMPLDKQRKQVLEELKYFKNQLKLTIQSKSPEQIQYYLKKLFELRAEQMILDLKEENDRYGSLDEDFRKAKIRRYYFDCKRLVQSITLLSK